MRGVRLHFFVMRRRHARLCAEFAVKRAHRGKAARGADLIDAFCALLQQLLAFGNAQAIDVLPKRHADLPFKEF